VEQALIRSAAIESAVVIGNQRKFLGAVIVPRPDKLRQYAAARNVPAPDADSPEIHPEIAAWIAAEIAQCSAGLAEHERIKRFCLLPAEALLHVQRSGSLFDHRIGNERGRRATAAGLGEDQQMIAISGMYF
jgi:long-subunit acyl-CoA synthetase (AMP-forming)